ncbi:hypothetical protein NC651_035717 [Populus alba x Populus x berolinensis]|nr:hypothetical protein NC651_035717 [Populus alba x Populus x berolinensis]
MPTRSGIQDFHKKKKEEEDEIPGKVNIEEFHSGFSHWNCISFTILDCI